MPAEREDGIGTASENRPPAVAAAARQPGRARRARRTGPAPWRRWRGPTATTPLRSAPCQPLLRAPMREQRLEQPSEVTTEQMRTTAIARATRPRWRASAINDEREPDQGRTARGRRDARGARASGARRGRLRSMNPCSVAASRPPNGGAKYASTSVTPRPARRARAASSAIRGVRTTTSGYAPANLSSKGIVYRLCPANVHSPGHGRPRHPCGRDRSSQAAAGGANHRRLGLGSHVRQGGDDLGHRGREHRGHAARRCFPVQQRVRADREDDLERRRRLQLHGHAQHLDALPRRGPQGTRARSRRWPSGGR